MGFFERAWRRFSGGGAAEKAELAGDLTKAIRLWVLAGAMDEAARVMLLRGDAEADPGERLQHYTQAATTANPGGARWQTACVKKARLIVSLAGDAALSGARRRDVIEAAGELERAGEPLAAAEAYALAGDREGEARALAKAGDIDRLEEVLSAEQAAATRGHVAHEAHARIDSLIALGRRREALALAEETPDDPASLARATRVRGARTAGPIVRLVLRGERVAIVLGDEITIGRSEASINVASGVLSRRHVRVFREGERFWIADLGTRNGTQLRGLGIPARLEVGDGVELTLGGGVPLRARPSASFAGALSLEIGGQKYVAPLGPARLGVGEWRLVQGPDGWVELVTDGERPAFAGDLVLAPEITLLRGDALSAARGAEVIARIEE